MERNYKKVNNEVNNESQTYNKAYLVRFINSLRLINASLDTHVKNFSYKIYKSVKIA